MMSPFTKLLLLCLFLAIFATVYSVSIAIRHDPFDGKQSSNVDGSDMVSSWFNDFVELNYGSILLLVPVVSVVGASLNLCVGHITNYNNPKEQGPIIAISALPAIFAVCSYLGFLLANGSDITSTVLDGITELYSAFTLVMFYQLLYAYLENRGMNLRHGRLIFLNMFPYTLFQPYEVPINRQTIHSYRRFVFQYFVIRLFGSCALTVLQVVERVPAYGAQCFTVMSLASYTIALLAIVIFFKAVRVDFEAHNLERKLFCLKGFVTFSFIQVYGIWFLQLKGFFDPSMSWFHIQNVLLLIELVPFTIYLVHCYSCGSYSQTIVQTEDGEGLNELHEI